MLRYIARSIYDDTEVEGIVLWNRLWSYATLFGYADQVSRVMKVRQIFLGKRVYEYLSTIQSSSYFLRKFP